MVTTQQMWLSALVAAAVLGVADPLGQLPSRGASVVVEVGRSFVKVKGR